MSNIAIQIEHLTKSYMIGQFNTSTFAQELRQKRKHIATSEPGYTHHEKSFLALNDVSLTVRKGEVLGIIGRNGSGKSTLLKILSRVTAPTAGKLTFQGKTASMLEVGTGFNPEMTGRENIYLNGAILGMNKKEIDEKLNRIIEFSECERFIDTPVKRYSSGMYVKLAFSVSIHLDSDILIMDEVLAVGDTAFQRKCLKYLYDAALNENRTVLFVTHSMDMLRKLCNRCIVLQSGKLIFDGDVDNAILIYSKALDESDNAGKKQGAGKAALKTPQVEISNAQKALELTHQKSSDGRDLMVRSFPLTPEDGEKKAKLLSIAILDKPFMKYRENETIKICITAQNKSDADYMLFRFVIKNAEMSPVAMGCSEPFPVYQDQMISKTCEISISTLITGSYSCDLYVGQNEGNSVQAFDSVRTAFRFDLTTNNHQQDIKWVPSAWGSSVLPVKQIEEE